MKAKILCYHKVDDGSNEGRRLNVEPRRLETHIRYYARHGRNFVTAREFPGRVPAGSVCFTFDDAYLSTMRNAPELLERYGARGTFYAVAGLLGQSSVWDGQAASRLAAAEDLSQAQARGHEIGNHSMHHPRMSGLEPSEQRREVLDAHERLLDLGLDIESFCYPYGSYDDATLEVMREAGYRAAVTLKKGPVTGNDDLLELPRIVIGYGDALPSFLYKTTLRQKLRKLGL